MTKTGSLWTLAIWFFATACTPTPTPDQDLKGNPGVDLGGVDGSSGSGDAETPPQGATALEAWLKAGSYKTWSCEAQATPRGGAHGTNRICSNDKMSRSASGEFPVGSAAVKEIVDGNQIRGYAVSLRTQAGAGDKAWYWYERIGTSTFADGIGVPLCNGCHSAAQRDYVYVRIPK